MAPRPFWKGYLKLSLVTCPVAMTPAVSENARIRFHILNRATGNPVESRYVDAESGETVAEENLVKGYARGENDYVLFEDDELRGVALESTSTIDIEKFAPDRDVDWIWYDRAHYLSPDDPVGEEAFAVIRDAMKASDVVGLSRLVLFQREHPVLLKPRDNGIIVWTLRPAAEVRDWKNYFDAIGEAKADPMALDLVARLMQEMSAPWDAKMAGDPVQEKLGEMIAARRKGLAKKPAKSRKEPSPRGGNVVDIFDALRKSISAERRR